MRLAAFVLIAALGVAPAALARPAARLVPNPNAGCEIRADGLTLVVRRDTGKTSRKAVCSRAGRKSRLQVVSDALDQSWVLLEESRGHGPNPAHRRELAVYLLTGHVIERARLHIADDWGRHGEWRYDYQVLRPAADGLELVLRRRTAGSGPRRELPPEGPRLVRVTVR